MIHDWEILAKSRYQELVREADRLRLRREALRQLVGRRHAQTRSN